MTSEAYEMRSYRPAALYLPTAFHAQADGASMYVSPRRSHTPCGSVTGLARENTVCGA